MARGGKRPGAGRRKGSLGAKTIEKRNLQALDLATKARAGWNHARLLELEKEGGPAGPAPSPDDDVAAVAFVNNLLVRCAAKGDGRAAIHLDERLRGRVPLGHEVAGPQGGAIEIKVRIVETVSEDAEE